MGGGDRFSKTPRRQVSWHLRRRRQCRIAAATSKRLVKQALNDCSYLDIESVVVGKRVTKRQPSVQARGRDFEARGHKFHVASCASRRSSLLNWVYETSRASSLPSLSLSVLSSRFIFFLFFVRFYSFLPVPSWLFLPPLIHAVTRRKEQYPPRGSLRINDGIILAEIISRAVLILFRFSGQPEDHLVRRLAFVCNYVRIVPGCENKGLVWSCYSRGGTAQRKREDSLGTSTWSINWICKWFSLRCIVPINRKKFLG